MLSGLVHIISIVKVLTFIYVFIAKLFLVWLIKIAWSNCKFLPGIAIVNLIVILVSVRVVILIAKVRSCSLYIY